MSATQTFWLVVSVCFAILHSIAYFLVPWLFSHGSSAAFEMGVGLSALIVIFWYVYILHVWKDIAAWRKRK